MKRKTNKPLYLLVIIVPAVEHLSWTTAIFEGLACADADLLLTAGFHEISPWATMQKLKNKHEVQSISHRLGKTLI